MINRIDKKIVIALAAAVPNNHQQFSYRIKKLAAAAKQPPPVKTKLLAAYKSLVAAGELTANLELEKMLITRAVRTLSGVSVITVLTKPFACPGRCVYCPTEAGMPKSYLSNEPAAQRALSLQFDPVVMVQRRVDALQANGHIVDKIELIVLGGTWSVYPKVYQDWFITRCFYAANTYGQKRRRTVGSLAQEQHQNEQARYRVIGLTLETRPDRITTVEVKQLRRLGCTRVQLGIQHTNDSILKLVRRGDTLASAITATRLLKEAGFKVDHHYMPDLPGSTPACDLAMFQYVFTSPDLQPDQIKIYPCIVNPLAELHQWWRKGKYKPYAEKKLFELLLKVKQLVPPYVRINRLVRDIPPESIAAGNSVTNLRQYLRDELGRQGKKCQCLNCREVRDQQGQETPQLTEQQYRASAGDECFLSFEDSTNRVHAFLRLRFNDHPEKSLFPELKGAALVREVHVYGQMIPVDAVGSGKQHRGLGSKLLARAEELARQRGLKKIAVISGIGARGYYRQLRYRLAGTYMVKGLVVE